MTQQNDKFTPAEILAAFFLFLLVLVLPGWIEDDPLTEAEYEAQQEVARYEARMEELQYEVAQIHRCQPILTAFNRGERARDAEVVECFDYPSEYITEEDIDTATEIAGETK